MTVKVANRKPHCLLDSLYLFSVKPDTCGSLPLSSMQQTMDHTLPKSLAVDNIDVPMTTYMSVTWMPSSLMSMSPQM